METIDELKSSYTGELIEWLLICLVSGKGTVGKGGQHESELAVRRQG